MLREHRASTYRYDSSADRAVLVVRPATKAARTVDATLLLDARRGLVGVDLRGGKPMGEVVMWGAHEDVAETRDVRVELATDDDGDPAEVVVTQASSVIAKPGEAPRR